MTKKFGSLGSIHLTEEDFERAKELWSKQHAVDSAIRTLMDLASETQMKWWKFWKLLRRHYEYPKEEDGYKIWLDPVTESLFWKKKKTSNDKSGAIQP